MLKIGVFGTGHLGKIHLNCLSELTDLYEISGFYDNDPVVSAEVALVYNLKSYRNPEELIADSDVLDIVTPTDTHFALAKKVLQAGKPLFIEKPITGTVEEAQALRILWEKAGVALQVGHVERYNPAFRSVLEYATEPMFIEGHRLAEFNPRGTEVSVVLDLMIHDLDLLCRLVPQEVVNIQAQGVAVVSDTPDICNARIEFANGAVANLTASRISLKQMRKLRLFQRDAYISLDFLSKDASVVKLHHKKPPESIQAHEIQYKGKSKWIEFVAVENKPINAIKEELKTFYSAIVNDQKPEVDIDDAIRALDLAEQIVNVVKQNAKNIPGR